jgi:hypothetical protein
VALHRTRKPVQNAFVQSFNSKLRDECLNEHIFLALAEARETIEEPQPYRRIVFICPSDPKAEQVQVAHSLEIAGHPVLGMAAKISGKEGNQHRDYAYAESIAVDLSASGLCFAILMPDY